MSAFRERVQAAWKARGCRVVRVPEWDLDLTVFPLTIGQISAINAETDPIRRAARIIQVRAKTPDGSRLLDDLDLEELCSYGINAFGPSVVVRVAGEIMADFSAPAPAEEAEKN